MILGLTTTSLPEGTLRDRIEWIRHHEFDALEILCVPIPARHAGVWPRHITPDQISDLRSSLRGFKHIALHAPFQNVFDVTLVSANPVIRHASVEEVVHTINMASEIGAKVVTFHTGWPSHVLTEAEVHENLRDSLTELNNHASEKKVLLAAEVADYFLSVEKYTLLEEWNLSNIGIALDLGHISFDWGKGVMYREFGSISGFIQRFAARLFHVHAHDYNGNDDHIAIGDGNIDFLDVVEALNAINYSDCLCFEFNPDKVPLPKILSSRRKIQQLMYEGKDFRPQ